MDVWTFCRMSLCLLVATFATGCGLVRGLRPDSALPPTPITPNPITPNPTPPQPQQPPPDTNALPVEPVSGGTVIAAGGSAGQPQPMPVPQPAPVPQPPAPLPQPRSTPPPAIVTPGYHPPPTLFADPHLRAMPTVTGGRLGLAPWEVPTDRVVELTTHIEALLAQNRDLEARIKELEALALGREQALAEAMREIDAVTATAAKDRAALLAQIAALQARIRQIEEEDIIFLRAVIDALKKLLPPENPP